MAGMTDLGYRSLMDLLPSGPWMWGGPDDDVRLSTVRGGQHYLMGTSRKGFGGSQFTFQVFSKIDKDDPWNCSGLLRKCHHDGLYIPRAPYDKKTIVGIGHPLAQLIKSIPEMVDRIEPIPEADGSMKVELDPKQFHDLKAETQSILDCLRGQTGDGYFISLVTRCITDVGDQFWAIDLAGGNDHELCAEIRSRISKKWGLVEVRMEW